MQSLITELPRIISDSEREVQIILDNLQSNMPIVLHTKEFVLPKLYNKTIHHESYSSHNNNRSNQLLEGDNYLIMQALLAGNPSTGEPSLRGKINLIYIDPPFDSRADYHSQHKLSSALTGESTTIDQFAYSDTWKEGTVSYLCMLCPRLMLMKELLHPEGSIYVHIDWHVGHYVKILLDEIFGREQFRNEIVWQRDAVGKGAKKTSKQWSRELESIYMYSKSDQMYFNQPYRQPHQLTYTQLKEFRYQEENGRKFKIVTLGDYSQASIEQMKSNNLIYTSSTGKEYKKYYLDEFQLAIGSLWNDIANLSHGKNNERLNFDTQKPEKLLERIIEASTSKNGLVADFFSGSGTTAAVAERLGRKWITSDIGKAALLTSRNRLSRQCQTPFSYRTLKSEHTDLFPVARLSLHTPIIEFQCEEWAIIHLELDHYCWTSSHQELMSQPEVRNIVEKDPLALLEYWCVDSNYSGEVFVNRWRQHRNQTVMKGEDSRVAMKLSITIPRNQGKRSLCVRAVDIFGFESQWNTTIEC